jgi:putative acetyltransferase
MNGTQIMCRIVRTNAADDDFSILAAGLEEELKIRDGEDHLLYAAINKAADLKHALVLYDSDTPAGCGALREHAPGIMEIKRVYVLLPFRRKGFASLILRELEAWCRELNSAECILETGLNQPEAIAFYRKEGYEEIPKFGKYTGSYNSVCFRKKLVR